MFCLVNANKLPFQVSEEIINNLEIITQGSQGAITFCLIFITSFVNLDFKIVILVTSVDQNRNHVSSRLSSSMRKLPELPSDEEIISYISSHTNISINLSGKTHQEE